jgi:hypothetical protein
MLAAPAIVSASSIMSVVPYDKWVVEGQYWFTKASHREIDSRMLAKGEAWMSLNGIGGPAHTREEIFARALASEGLYPIAFPEMKWL